MCAARSVEFPGDQRAMNVCAEELDDEPSGEAEHLSTMAAADMSEQMADVHAGNDDLARADAGT